MKKTIVTIILASCTLASIAQTQTLERLFTVESGASLNYMYNGGVSISKVAASSQYINLSREGASKWSLGTVYNSNTFAIGQSTSTESGFTAPAFTIRTDGNVGLGSSNPDYKLDVNLASTAGIARLFNGSNYFKIGGLGTGTAYMTGFENLVAFGNNYANGSTALYAGNAEKLRILPSGNVGIGITSPTSKLHISNTTSLSGIGGANINVVQTQSNTADASDGGLSVAYSLTTSSANNELVSKAVAIRSNNYMTGGGTVQYQRVLNLSSGSNAGSNTTNLEMIRIENGTSDGAVTNGYGINIASLQGTNKWGIYDQSGSNWYTNGQVGIGTTTPWIGTKLDVRGNIFLDSGNDDTHILWGGHNMTMGTPVDQYANNIFSLKPGGSSIGALSSSLGLWNANSAAEIDKVQTIQLHSNGNSYFNGGNVGIGTKSPQCMLDVAGRIRANGIKVVPLTDFTYADFVFKSDYKLPKLKDVDNFIQTNGHLPNIPSEAEAKENGIDLVQMQVKLLQKVEELTLYVIEQQKEIEKLKAGNKVQN